MTKHIKNRDTIILDFIRAYSAEHGFAPSIREIARAVGLASTSAVHHWIKKMEADGSLVRSRAVSRGIPIECPNCGHLIGSPVAVEEAA